MSEEIIRRAIARLLRLDDWQRNWAAAERAFDAEYERDAERYGRSGSSAWPSSDERELAVREIATRIPIRDDR